MIKKIILSLVVLCSISCSRESMEKGGWLPPLPQQSKMMKTESGNFATDNNTAEIRYYFSLGFVNEEAYKAKWIIVNFEDPKNRGTFLKKILPLTGKKTPIRILSDPVYGVANFQAYLVKIQLSNDKEGLDVVDVLNQYVRARIPYNIIAYNMKIPKEGKRFYISGKKEPEEYKDKQYSKELSNFFPDDVNSKNFTVINAGYWIYYDIEREDAPYTTHYKNSNLAVRYEFTLNRKTQFKERIYQRAILENPEDRNKPFTYDGYLEPNQKAAKVFHAPVKGLKIGKKYKLTFEFYSDKERTKLIERVSQEIRSPMDNTAGCIVLMPELITYSPEISRWSCDK